MWAARPWAARRSSAADLGVSAASADSAGADVERIASTPRPDWQEIVEGRGLKWHTGQTPYWSEDAYYEFTTDQIDTIERATNELHARCLEAVQHVIDAKRYAELRIPDSAIPLITKSWNDEPPSVYGRFDLAYDGTSPP